LVRNEQARIREALRRFDLYENRLLKESDVPVYDEPDREEQAKTLWQLRAKREEALHSLIHAVRRYLKPV
jgi:hypothetical protein